jgi:hypothetical protein
MTRMSSMKPRFRGRARCTMASIDGPFVETKEWVLAAEPGPVAAARSVRVPNPEILALRCRFAGSSIDNSVAEARCEEL